MGFELAQLAELRDEVVTRHHQLRRPNPETDVQLFCRHGRTSTRDAKTTLKRAAACELVPGLGAALGDGAVSAGHVDAFARATNGLNDRQRAAVAARETELVERASVQTPEQFAYTAQAIVRDVCDDDGADALERIRAKRSVRTWRDVDTGLQHTDLALDPLAHERLWTAIRAAIRTAQQQRQDGDTRTWDQFRADVIVELVTNPDHRHRAGLPEISVLVDLPTLLDQANAVGICETVDGTPVPVATLRRLCCDADILPVTLGGDGIPLDVGRTERTATPAQRRALRAMYRTCGWNGCTMLFEDCQIHHVTWYRHGGRSDLANLLPLCNQHHHDAHEGGWTLRLHPDRRLTITTPDGQPHHDATTTNRRPPPAAAVDARANAPSDTRSAFRLAADQASAAAAADSDASLARCLATCAELDRLVAATEARDRAARDDHRAGDDTTDRHPADATTRRTAQRAHATHRHPRTTTSERPNRTAATRRHRQRRRQRPEYPTDDELTAATRRRIDQLIALTKG